MEIEKIEIQKGIDVSETLTSTLSQKVRDDFERIEKYSISMNGNTFLFNNCLVYHDEKKSKFILIKKRIDPRIAMHNGGKIAEFYLVKMNDINNMESAANLEKGFESISRNTFSNLDVNRISSTKIIF